MMFGHCVFIIVGKYLFTGICEKRDEKGNNNEKQTKTKER
jgi:hypothetical protein